MQLGLTPKQLRDRRTRVSASDVGPILGLHPSRGPWSVYAEKHGIYSTQQEPIMTLGLMVEPMVREAGAEILGAPIAPSGTLLFDDWAAATPDGLIGADAGVEIKLSIFGDGAWGQEGTDEVPRHYVTQCNWAMHWTGRHTWHLLRLDVGMDLGNLAAWMVEQGRDPLPLLSDALQTGYGARIRHYRMTYRESLALKVVARCRAFWERYIDGDEMPEPNDEEICGRAVRAIRDDVAAHRERLSVPSGEDVAAALRAYRDADAGEREAGAGKRTSLNAWRLADARKQAARAGLEEAFGDRTEMHVPGVGRATFRANRAGARVLRCSWEE